ncbi:hypothetical protein ACO0RG_002342 [Hanseniaspora osmophila]|uniref:COMPASS component SWD1 n=1 Tax=Hanseniaspora osmophila TaxID=56408 RepID=A0A1E5RVM3_9ASCO|nr:COMPASS component SWD1 [Hanseniaspora osmophila]
MNLLLQDPFSVLKEYPENLANILETPLYTVIQKFSPNGDYLAVGCVDGTLIIYDMDTLKPIRILGSQRQKSNGHHEPQLEMFNGTHASVGHTQAIQSIQWSSNGRFLLTSSRDCTVKLWDLLHTNDASVTHTGNFHQCKSFTFDTFVWSASFLPGDTQCVVCVSTNALPFIIDFSTEVVCPIVDRERNATLVYDDCKKYGNSISNFVFEGNTQYASSLEEKPHSNDELLASTASGAVPNNVEKRNEEVNAERGFEKVLQKNIILVGTTKGWLTIYEMVGMNRIVFLESIKITSSSIKNIILSEAGNLLCLNGADRTIRQYALSFENQNDYNTEKETGNTQSLSNAKIALHFQHKYQDVINKLQWNSISLSPKYGEYLVASTHGSSAHDIYLWETSSGFLVRVLEDAGEELLNIDWNYHTMDIVSNGLETGNVYNWSIVVPPKWSALAPDFEEVDENVKYMEKEDEFDEYDEELERNDRNKLEEKDLDLVTCESFDVRGNAINTKIISIPLEYDKIVQLRNAQ